MCIIYYISMALPDSVPPVDVIEPAYTGTTCANFYIQISVLFVCESQSYNYRKWYHKKNFV